MSRIVRINVGWALALLLATSMGRSADNPCIFQGERTGSDTVHDGQQQGQPPHPLEARVSELVRVIGGLRILTYPVRGLNNACAARPKEKRVVYYDPDWLKSYTEGNEWVLVGVLAHEVGHLLYEHRPDDGMPSLRREYEADFFVGQAVASLGGSRQDAALAVSKQPLDATNEYPSRAVRVATVVEGFDLRDGIRLVVADENVSPVSMEIGLGASRLDYRVNGVSFSADVLEYQDGVPVTEDDVVKQAYTVAARLGREDDMVVLSAFKEVDGSICAKNLYMQIRDGQDIDVQPVTSKWGAGEYFGIRYGRKRDLFNVVGVRANDWEFVFDPSAPRTGQNRNPVTKIADSIKEGAEGLYIEDLGCKGANDWAWSDVTAGLQWSLKDGVGVSMPARNLMIAALEKGTLEALEDLQTGYNQTQSHNEESRKAFQIVRGEDPKRLYNAGRIILGLPEL